MKELKKTELRELETNTEEDYIIDFYGLWCMPCKMLEPVLNEVEGEYEKLDFYKFNATENLDIAKEYNVSTTPTTIIFRNGVEVERINGFKTKEELMKIINNNIH